MAWSSEALACGMSGVGAIGAAAVIPVLLLVFGVSLVAVLSLRAAGNAFGRMRSVRPGTGLQLAHFVVTTGYALSIASTIVAGGLLLALTLVG